MIKKLEVKIAVITGGTEGTGIGSSKLFVKGVPMMTTTQSTKQIDGVRRQQGSVQPR